MKKNRAVKKRLLITAAAAFVIVYIIVTRENGFALGIVNAAFILGTVFTLVACAGYIHNVGLFKTFAYTAYKTRTRTKNKRDGIRSITLAEYTAERMLEKNQWDTRKYLLTGLPLLVGSYVLAFVLRKV